MVASGSERVNQFLNLTHRHSWPLTRPAISFQGGTKPRLKRAAEIEHITHASPEIIFKFSQQESNPWPTTHQSGALPMNYAVTRGSLGGGPHLDPLLWLVFSKLIMCSQILVIFYDFICSVHNICLTQIAKISLNFSRLFLLFWFRRLSREY